MITLLLSALLVIAVAALGWAILPILSMVVTLPIMFTLRLMNKFLAYMISRYVSLFFDIAVLALLINWAGAKFGLITWPAWLVAGWCMVAAGNTLILFDIQCYLNNSGAWARHRGEASA